MGVLTALAILAGLIVVHEAGHFLAATWQGIRVSGFSVGFGPALLQRSRRGVVYALRAIPLGGYVAFPDDDEDSPFPADDPNLLRNRPLHQRALVIAAGVIANLLLAWAVLLAQGVVVGIPAGFSTTPGVLVAGVQGGQAAANAGLRAGDRIVALAGQPLEGGQQAVAELVSTIRNAPGRTLPIEAERDQQRINLSLTPADLGGIGRIGAQLQPNGSEVYRRPRNALEPLLQANHAVVVLTRRTVEGFGTLLTHFGETAGQVSGPVKIVEMGGLPGPPGRRQPVRVHRPDLDQPGGAQRPAAAVARWRPVRPAAARRTAGPSPAGPLPDGLHAVGLRVPGGAEPDPDREGHQPAASHPAVAGPLNTPSGWQGRVANSETTSKRPHGEEVDDRARYQAPQNGGSLRRQAHRPQGRLRCGQ